MQLQILQLKKVDQMNNHVTLYGIFGANGGTHASHLQRGAARRL